MRLLLLAAAAGLGGLIGGDAGYLARNAALVLLAPFAVAGVIDLHRRLAARRWGGLWLGAFYGVLFVLMGWALLAVTVWGVVSQWIRARPPEDSGKRDPGFQEKSDGSHSA
jgi:uncharacterized membrane protein HdeD (DUF308 family)